MLFLRFPDTISVWSHLFGSKLAVSSLNKSQFFLIKRFSGMFTVFPVQTFFESDSVLEIWILQQFL